MFSNAYIKQLITLPGNITLVPCFSLDLSKIESNIDRLTLDMKRKGRFIYDGWLPIDDWDKANVREAIITIDSALTVFALLASAWFSWDSKYSMMMQGGISYEFEQNNITEINQLTNYINELNQQDARALLNSISWFSQSIRLTEPAARFLFNIVAIESLATYIEQSEEGSAFSQLRYNKLTKQQQNQERQDCISDIMAELLETNPVQAVQEAYFNCIVGIKQRIQNHLQGVFQEDTAPVQMLFSFKVDGKTLYDLRNEIAHGSMDALSEAQREVVLTRAFDLENIARSYLHKVIEKVTGVNLEDHMILESISPGLNQGINSNEGMYQGPTHMAIVYSSVFDESIRAG